MALSKCSFRRSWVDLTLIFCCSAAVVCPSLQDLSGEQISLMQHYRRGGYDILLPLDTAEARVKLSKQLSPQAPLPKPSFRLPGISDLPWQRCRTSNAEMATFAHQTILVHAMSVPRP